MSRAIEDVLEERERQRSGEGFTNNHDDQYGSQELARAAACYAITEEYDRTPDVLIKNLWPWGLKWWKPADRRRNLIKAAALLIADIERYDRHYAINDSKGQK